MEVNIHEAKINLSRLLRRVAGGKEIIIANAGVPVARPVPAEPAGTERKLGSHDGLIWMANDFTDELSDGHREFLSQMQRPRRMS